MKMNKILIASLISSSILFTGFKPKTPWTISLPEYENYTYEQVLKEERLDSANKPYTYFEYNFTNIGEGYIEDLVVVPFKTVRAEQKKDGDILQSYYSFLPPGASAVYYFNIYDYADEEISFEAHGYGSDQLASNVTYSSLTTEYVGTPGNSDGVYIYQYVFTMNISYDIEDSYDYSEFIFIYYQGVTYPFYYGPGEVWVRAKETLDVSQLSASVIAFKHKQIEMGSCIRDFGFNIDQLIIGIFITCGVLAIAGTLTPVVIYATKKIKNRKTK